MLAQTGNGCGSGGRGLRAAPWNEGASGLTPSGAAQEGATSCWRPRLLQVDRRSSDDRPAPVRTDSVAVGTGFWRLGPIIAGREEALLRAEEPGGHGLP